jgi:hypothetical protein|nr:MAG TPA: hypothetical protein [Caudoviricetes sp.]
MKIHYYTHTTDTFEYFPQFSYVPLLHSEKTKNLALHRFTTGFMSNFLDSDSDSLLVGMSYVNFLKAKTVIFLTPGFQLNSKMVPIPSQKCFASMLAITEALEIPTLLFTPPTQHYSVDRYAKSPACYSQHTGIPPIVHQELRKLNLEPDDKVLVFGRLSGWVTKDFKNILEILDGFAHANSYAK